MDSAASTFCSYPLHFCCCMKGQAAASSPCPWKRLGAQPQLRGHCQDAARVQCPLCWPQRSWLCTGGAIADESWVRPSIDCCFCALREFVHADLRGRVLDADAELLQLIQARQWPCTQWLHVCVLPSCHAEAPDCPDRDDTVLRGAGRCAKMWWSSDIHAADSSSSCACQVTSTPGTHMCRLPPS